MKILFNLMDTENSGKISLSEIEVRWKDQNSREIISHLKKITPASGLLSFERFTSGLQMFLSTQKIQNNKTPKSRQFSQNSSSNLLTTVGIPDASNLMGPPKPPRMMFPSSSYEKDQQLSKMEIMTNLQKWQQNLLLANGTNQQRHTGDGQQKINPKRRDPRRHTLQNGIDYNMLKRLKQIELEKDILMQGLNTVETARSWYAKQISAVDEKLRYMTLTGNHTVKNDNIKYLSVAINKIYFILGPVDRDLSRAFGSSTGSC